MLVSSTASDPKLRLNKLGDREVQAIYYRKLLAYRDSLFLTLSEF
jgi:hypothetical protein